jgi:hypothetical protein
MDLSKIAALETTFVTIRGEPVTVRALSAEETLLIDGQAPVPFVPTNQELSPAATELRARHNALRRVLRVSAACGITDTGGQSWSKEWTPDQARKHADEVMQTLTADELFVLEAALRRVSGFMTDEQIEGIIGGKASAS